MYGHGQSDIDRRANSHELFWNTCILLPYRTNLASHHITIITSLSKEIQIHKSQSIRVTTSISLPNKLKENP